MSYYKTDRGVLIEEYDEDVINPREENYSGSCFLTFSRNHSSPDENEYRTMQDFLLAMGAIQADKLYSDGNIPDGNDAMMKTLDRKGYISLPVYKYEHSGVCYTAAERNPFNCDWDSCLIGIIYISKTDAKTVFNATRLTKNVKEKVLDLLKAEVKVYSDWADGNCHYYQLMETVKKLIHVVDLSEMLKKMVFLKHSRLKNMNLSLMNLIMISTIKILSMHW